MKNLLQIVKYCLQPIKPARIRRAVFNLMPRTVHVGSRAFCKSASTNARSCIKKTFNSNQEGIDCYRNELLARQIFGNRPWLAPIIEKGDRWLVFPRYPEEMRLDRAARNMNRKMRLKVAKQAVWILFDIFSKGYAHRDFHAKNLFWIRKQLVVIDFEEMVSYPNGKRPAFPRSFDIVGEGLDDSPFGGNIMSYIADTPSRMSLLHVLGIPINEVLLEFENTFKASLRQTTKKFKTQDGNHICRENRIYCSFNLPHLTIEKNEAQRDSARRLELFRINEDILQNKSLLDLGCNTGGMIFEAQKLKPAQCVGVEYDSDKVELANKIATYCGLNNTKFICGDIDEVDIQKIGGKFDVIFCLAIEAHVKKKSRLYQLLAEISNDVVYFEGNSTTDPELVKSMLRENGFKHVEMLGFSDDDCREDHTPRPLFIAKK